MSRATAEQRSGDLPEALYRQGEIYFDVILVVFSLIDVQGILKTRANGALSRPQSEFYRVLIRGFKHPGTLEHLDHVFLRRNEPFSTCERLRDSCAHLCERGVSPGIQIARRRLHDLRNLVADCRQLKQQLILHTSVQAFTGGSPPGSACVWCLVLGALSPLLPPGYGPVFGPQSKVTAQSRSQQHIPNNGGSPR